MNQHLQRQFQTVRAACLGLLCAFAADGASATASAVEYQKLVDDAQKKLHIECTFYMRQAVILKTQEEVDTLTQDGQEFDKCIKDYAALMGRYGRLEESGEPKILAKLSDDQRASYRQAVVKLANDDFARNKERLMTNMAAINESLQMHNAYGFPKKGVPRAQLAKILARLDDYGFTCELPDFVSGTSRQVVDSFNKKWFAYLDCASAWTGRAQDLRKFGKDAILTDEEYKALSPDQMNELREPVQEVVENVLPVEESRRDRMSRGMQARIDREAAENAEAADIRATAQAAREALRVAATRMAAMSNTAGSTASGGRYVPLVIPKRPGQP